MKKKLSVIFSTVIVFAAIISVWFCGYDSRKSSDDILPLAVFAEMRDDGVADVLLPGYRIKQLRDAWGEPQYHEGNTDIWKTGDNALVVNYNSIGVVVSCGITLYGDCYSPSLSIS